MTFCWLSLSDGCDDDDDDDDGNDDDADDDEGATDVTAETVCVAFWIGKGAAL